MARSRAKWLDGQNSWEKASCPTATPAVVPDGRSQPTHYSWVDPDLMQMFSREPGVLFRFLMPATATQDGHPGPEENRGQQGPKCFEIFHPEIDHG